MDKKGGSKGILIALIAVVLVLGISVSGTYNALVNASEKVDASYADIDTQLQRRSDLIPNLINTVKGYMAHEKEVIDSVTESREKLLGAKNIQEMADANEELSTALSNMLVLVENYPELKSNENFIQLQDELAGTENRIATARRDYNDAVREYNARTKRFPGVIFARLFGFDPAEYFEAAAGSTEVPNVQF